MAPRNVALVGASDRNWSPRVWDNLTRFGFPGKAYAVNPGRDEIWGARCYKSLADLPEPPDHLAMFVPSEQSLETLIEGGKLGARSATIFAAGFGEGGDAEGLARAKRLSAILDQYGIAAVGPNCMGLAVGSSRFSTMPDEQLHELTTGPVAVLTQSGMLAQTLSRGVSDAGLDLAYLISLGNQTGLQFADYIDHLARVPALRVIACYIETVKDAPRFLAAARRARDAGKQIVVVKAGGSEDSRKAALAHTGSLAGSAEIFEVFARDAGVIRVDNLEDMIEAAEFFSRARPLIGRRICVMTNSGALKSLMTEAAETHGVELARLAPETSARLKAALHDADVANPFDTKRTIRVEEYMGCIGALHDDPNVDLLLLAEEMPRAAGIERKVKNLTALNDFTTEKATKPIVVFSPLACHDTDYMRELRGGLQSLPWLRDIGRTFRLLGKITAPSTTLVTAPAPREHMRAAIDKWRARATRLDGPTALNEAESKQLLAEWGIPVAPEIIVQSSEEAVTAATRIGFPVVMKAVSAAVPHKSDAGLVLLGIADATAAKDGAETIAARCAALQAPLEGILVAKQMTDGVEMVVGIHNDPEMGPAIMVGMGGVWLELFKDVAFAPPGLGRERALETIARTRASALLNGYRGSSPRDVDALADALVSLGHLAVELGDVIEAVDVNPLLVCKKGDGVFALDGLVVLRPPLGEFE
jgi:acyl-CoA synthetase (NDP forming)